MSKGPGNAFFTEFLADYFAESEEHLNAARRNLTMLESVRGKVDLKAVEELLRNFHSIKGLSAMVGFDDIAQIAHRLEDYLRNLKEPKAAVRTDDVEQFFHAIESVEQALVAYRKRETGPDLRAALLALDGLGSELSAVAPGHRAGPTSVPSPLPARNALQTWKFEFRPTPELSANGVSVTSVRDKLESIGTLIEASPKIREGGAIAFEFVISTNADQSDFEQFASQGVTYTKVDSFQEGSAQPADGTTTPRQSQDSDAISLIRVDMRRLDELMRLVGELVISRAHLDQTLDAAQKSIPPVQWRALDEINSAMGRQLRDVRESIMRVRMVPIGQVFERMRFVMRGLERETQKRIRLQIQGQDTEIDKMVVERIMDPILHLVRNAASHGVETPSERVAAGKPPEGLIRLKASGEGETVLVEVEDDGRGIDLEKVEKRAREVGLLRPEEQMAETKVLDLISAPGFSTREMADLASGRGVGMAVVLNTVQGLGGTISLDTASGRGTRFTLRLPLTLAIADALLVEAAGQQYAVPQAAVREVLSAEASSVVKFENNEVIPYRGGILPIVRLRRVFRLNGGPENRFHVLVLTGSEIGLVVDRIVGHREILIRAIADPELPIPGVTGATELGDGHPILILDTQVLIRLHAKQGL